MRAIHKPTDEEVRAERKRRYLGSWPTEKQLEAYSEAAMGRPEKQIQMLEDFAEIRRVLPFYAKEGDPV